MAINGKKVKEIIPTRNIWVGNPDAPVKLLEFGDYESEDCAKANEIVKKLLGKFAGQVRFNYRHFPLTQVHQHAHKAAEASIAAAQEGKFWEMHNLIFENRRHLGVISLRGYAREVGITGKPGKYFLDALMDSVYGWSVRNDLLEGLDKGVRDVPVFFINGERYAGKLSVEGLSKAIREALDQPGEKTAA